MVWVGELKVEVIVEQGHGISDHYFGESFTDANSFSAQERRKSERISRTAIGPLVPLTLTIESIWNELGGVSPLSWVWMQSLDVYNNHWVRFELNAIQNYLSAHVLCCRDWDGRFDSQSFEKALLDVLKIHHGVEVQTVLYVIFYFFHWWQNLIEEASLYFLVHFHVAN